MKKTNSAILIGYDPIRIKQLKKEYGNIFVITEKKRFFHRFIPYIGFVYCKLNTFDIVAMYINNIADSMQDDLIFVYSTEKYGKLLLSCKPLIESSCIVLSEDKL